MHGAASLGGLDEAFEGSVVQTLHCRAYNCTMGRIANSAQYTTCWGGLLRKYVRAPHAGLCVFVLVNFVHAYVFPGFKFESQSPCQSRCHPSLDDFGILPSRTPVLTENMSTSSECALCTTCGLCVITHCES